MHKSLEKLQRDTERWGSRKAILPVQLCVCLCCAYTRPCYFSLTLCYFSLTLSHLQIQDKEKDLLHSTLLAIHNVSTHSSGKSIAQALKHEGHAH